MCTIHAGCVVALRCHILQTVIEPWHARVRLWSDWWSTVLTYSPWVDSTSPSILDLIIFGKTLQLVSWCDARLRLAVSIVCMEDLLRLRAVGIWVEICLSQATSSDCRQRWWMWYFVNYWHIIDITRYLVCDILYDVWCPASLWNNIGWPKLQESAGSVVHWRSWSWSKPGETVERAL